MALETFTVSWPVSDDPPPNGYVTNAFDRLALRRGCRWVSRVSRTERVEGKLYSVEERVAEIPDDYEPVHLDIIGPDGKCHRIEG